MSLDPLIEALRSAGDSQGVPNVKLATVTGGTATTVSVRFDGETSASSRAYKKLYAPAFVGDRVVMLRVGSTYVAVGRIPSGTTDSPDTGWIAPSLQNGWGNYGGGWEPAGYRRLNGETHLRGLISGGVTTDATGIFQLPTGFRPSSDKHISIASANAFGIVKVRADGWVTTGTPITASWASLANISFPADL